MEEERFSDSIRRFLKIGVVCFIALLAYSILTLSFVPGPHVTPAIECINNLRLIEGAKQMWTVEHHKADGDMPTWDDIKPYVGRSLNDYLNIKCPSGGTYTLGASSNIATCSI